MKLDRFHRVPGIDKPLAALALGSTKFSTENRSDCFAWLDMYCAVNGNVIDTAHAYGAGTSEVVIGEWLQLRKIRDEFVIITKGGDSPDGRLPASDFEGCIGDQLSVSLDRLQIDRVDGYMLHRDNPELAVGRILEFLNARREEGRFDAFFASNWGYDRLEEAHRYAEAHGLVGFSAVSNNLALALPTGNFYPGLVSVDKSGEAWHEKSGTALIPWSSLARGFFSGRYRVPWEGCHLPGEDEFSAKMRRYYVSPENLAKLRRAEQIAANRENCTATEVALRWLLRKPFAVIPAVGPHSRAHMQSCVRATRMDLSNEEIAYLDGSSDSPH